MKNPCLIIGGPRPLISLFRDEATADAAGQSWQRENGDDLRWNVADLEVVTVIWGDDEYTGPGVFHFTQVELGEASYHDKGFQPVDIARRQFYDEMLAADPEYFDQCEGPEDNLITTTVTPAEYLDIDFTLIAVLPGRIEEV